MLDYNLHEGLGAILERNESQSLIVRESGKGCVEMSKKYRENKSNIVTLSVSELEELVYKASYSAARKVEDQLFGGLLGFINRLYDENEMVLESLDYLKTVVQQPVEKPKKRATRKKKVEEVNIDPVVKPDSKLAQIISNLTDEQKEAISKSMKESMQTAMMTSRPEINIPDGYKFD